MLSPTINAITPKIVSIITIIGLTSNAVNNASVIVPSINQLTISIIAPMMIAGKAIKKAMIYPKPILYLLVFLY